MAVIRTASGVAPLSGRYARRSITTPSTVQPITEIIIPSHSGRPDILTV